MSAPWIVLASGAVSLLTLYLMLRSGRTGPLDMPNHRSLHSTPVPRSGGVGIMAGIALAAVFGSPSVTIVFAAAGLAAISWWDDHHPLPVRIRFAAQLVAATSVVTLGSAPDWGWAGLLVMILAVIWMTNLYNFMDGANGLAGGMALFGFGAYAVAAYLSDNIHLAYFNASIAAAAAGFLIFNFDPAKVFMGDVGSIPLGFFAATLGLHGIANGTWPVWFPLLVFSPFIVDATVTLLKRALRHEKVWEAHREHAYQRLVGTGWTHRTLAVRAYALMLIIAVVALAVLGQAAPLQWTLLVFMGIGYVVLLIAIERHIGLRTASKLPNEPN